MFGPLTFDESEQVSETGGKESSCLLCDDLFNLKEGFAEFVKHVFEVHHLVIETVQNIEDLPRYVQFWKTRFQAVPIETIVPAITVDQTDQKFFVLSDLLKDDKTLRHEIRLDHVLDRQKFERSDTNYKRNCLFCRLSFEGNRLDFVRHLNDKHNLFVGHPQNLVYIDEFIDKLDTLLNTNLQCLFCEKTFRDRAVLTEHMRKKQHKRIRPENQAYDKYYMINYLELDRTWTDLSREDDRLPIQLDENSDAEYSDWEEPEKNLISCLFCDHRVGDIGVIHAHMSTAHGFDYTQLTETMDFYLQIKLVNYIRKQVYRNACVACDMVFERKEQLQDHFLESGHCVLPDKKVYDQPEYFFSTYENDAFLYSITENDANDEC